MEACIDEAGRGCVFGPVCAAAVIWDDSIDHPYLKDSKKLTEHRRNVAFDFVRDNAIAFSVQYASHEEIDAMNISNATQLAMHRCLDALDLDFDTIRVDGNFFKPYRRIPHACITGGDASVKGISAASILAKVSRDRWVCELADAEESLRVYNIQRHKGYCTAAHVDAIKNCGRSRWHRMSFRLPFEKVWL